METQIFSGIIIILLSAVFVTTALKRLNLPPVLGYLIVGAIVGPYGIGLLSNTHAIQQLAEFGVVFLMFTIGLEFSVAKLLSMKRLVLGLGGLQVILTTLIIVGVAYFLGTTITTAIVIGGVVAMSSTAITIKQLQEQFELNTPHGYNAVGVLLFQDVAVIAFLILLSSLSTGGQSVLLPLFLALMKAIAVMALILVGGRWVLRPLFHVIASAKSLELFTLAVLLVTLSAAWLTEMMGLSMALGAFLAGMMLGETEYRHQIEIEIRPFRDLLLGLFFITIGMLLDFSHLHEIWLSVLVILVALIVFKTLVITGLSRLFGSDNFTAWRTGITLAQGGEFGFALLTVAMDQNLLEGGHNQIILAALIFSIALSPFLIRYNSALAKIFVPKAAKICEKSQEQHIEENAELLKNHIIICGYGRVGQHIARIIETEGFEFIALDMDPKRVQDAQLAGERVNYGDSQNLNMLASAGIARAKALILSFNDINASKMIIPQVRKIFPNLPILVRTQDDVALKELLDLGATEIVPETLEASLMLAFHALILMDVPAARALRQIRAVRTDRYELLHHIFPSHELEDLENFEQEREQLYVVNLYESAAAIDKTIADLNLEQCEVEVSALRRDAIRRPDPDPKTVLQSGDILILYGTTAHLEHAERLILEG